jgi:hypothetical protein
VQIYLVDRDAILVWYNGAWHHCWSSNMGTPNYRPPELFAARGPAAQLQMAASLKAMDYAAGRTVMRIIASPADDFFPVSNVGVSHRRALLCCGVLLCDLM